MDYGCALHQIETDLGVQLMEIVMIITVISLGFLLLRQQVTLQYYFEVFMI